MLKCVIAAIGALWTVAVSAKEMDFRIAEDGSTVPQSWIVADGEITRDTPDHFRKFVQKEGIDSAKIEVYLNSPGGNLIGGLKLGETIREFGFNTRVARSVPNIGQFEMDAPGECYSACAFTFLGGKSRIAPDRSVGVHQHYTDEALSDPDAKRYTASDLSFEQIIAGVLADYVVRMGVDARFLTLASLTRPKDIYRFTSVLLPPNDRTGSRG